jgi:transposase
MTERKSRRFTGDEKLTILKEAEQPGVGISEVCRKHGLATSVFYSWRAVAHKAASDALKNATPGKSGKTDHEVERMRAELERLRAVVTEITAENLELKKKI